MAVDQNGKDDAQIPMEMTPDVAKICGIVRALPLAMDLAEYNLLAKVFAPNFVSDYTSLWGGEPMRLTPAELIEQWRSLVPGFDATWHDVSDIRVSVDGDKATGCARVCASHWAEGVYWQMRGRYDWQLERIDGVWKILHHLFTFEGEAGDRHVLQRAGELGKLTPDRS